MQQPPKPKGQPHDLAEVERALSVLQGRHPEHERVRREDEEARAKRRAVIEAASRIESSKVLKRRLVVGAIVVAVLGVATVGGLVFRSELARRSAIERATDPFRSMGFVVVETSSRSKPGRVEAVPDAGCVLAVSTGAAPLKVDYAHGSVEGPSPALLCTCAAERIAVTSNVGEDGGLAILRVDAGILGGSRAFAFAPFQPGVTASADHACAEASLDAWIAAKRAPHADADDAFFRADPKRAALTAVGFHTVARVGAGKPFAAVDVPAESCLLAASDAPADHLSLRLTGGALPLAPSEGGAIAWCASAASSLVVAREGDGAVSVALAPAASVGGLLGLAEVASEAGVALAARAVPPVDHTWDAKQLLLASAVPASVVTTASAPEVPPAPEARVVALSFGSPSALASESPDGVFSYCAPPMGDAVPQALCVFSGEQTWRPPGAGATGGLARAKLPFWLLAFEGVSEPVALQAEVELLAFARRLRRQGFEPTTIDAVTELPDGAEVLGRSGEDAVVALGVAPVAPWVFPYSDGPKWRIDGEPRVVPLATLATVKLASTVKPLPSKAQRRTVVFRRQKGK